MAFEEYIRLLTSFLGGGFVAGIINWIRQNRVDKTTRKVEHLTDQIKFLYGPLFFFTSQNNEIFKLSNLYNDAYKAEYIDVEWSRDVHTRKILKEETLVTLSLMNQYVSMIKDNNDRVASILESNYHYIDPSDIAVFQTFLVDYTRMRKEVAEDGTLLTPLAIYGQIGDISYMRPEFMELVKKRFTEKEQEIQQHRAV